MGLLLTPPGASGLSANGSVTMYPGNASISHTLTASGGLAVSGVTRVLENNVVATTLLCLYVHFGVGARRPVLAGLMVAGRVGASIAAE